MNVRLEKLISFFNPGKIDAYLVTKEINIVYLTGFPASESWLLVSPQKTFYLTDSRYVLEAQKGLKGLASVSCYAGSIFEMVFQIAKEKRIKRIGFDERHLTLAQYNALKEKCPPTIKFVGRNGLIENLREQKDPQEIKKIKKALNIHQQALKFIKPFIKPRISEQEILERLESFVKSKKASFSFPPIIASGENSCYPHARVTDRKLRPDDIVLLDMGIDVFGYKSDLTRMSFLGKIPPLVRHVNECVRAAQQKAIAKIKPGIRVSLIDQEARNYLAKHKLAKFFGHALGHGVGLEIHESPRLSKDSAAVLREGMVITVEPAVYVPKKFGIRLEEMVLVTPEGFEVLSADID